MLFESGPAGAGVAVGALALLGCLVALQRQPAEDGVRRWLRAGAYFGGCLVAAALTGVTDALLTGRPLGDGGLDDPVFLGALAGCVLLEVVAYGVVWPLGTYTLDRPRDLAAGIGFGSVWGLAEAQLLLSLWAVIEQTGWRLGLVALASFVLMSALQGGWHALYWDRHVAPEHNDPAWNLGKVLLCHVPNLAATLTLLAVYRAPLLFVLLQTLALVLSCCAMRFPRPTTRQVTVSA